MGSSPILSIAIHCQVFGGKLLTSGFGVGCLVISEWGVNTRVGGGYWNSNILETLRNGFVSMKDSSYVLTDLDNPMKVR